MALTANANLLNLQVAQIAATQAGLRARAQKDSIGGNEEGFIEPLAQIIDSGKTRAEELLERYEGPWARDASHIFAEYSY